MKRIGLLLWLAFSLCLTASAQLPYHIVLLGDSNTFLGGDACDKPQGWNKWFKDFAKPKSCRSYARSGATWTHTPQTVYDTKENVGVISDNNVIYNQVNRLKEAVEAGKQVAPDLIIIMAGTNDLWFSDKRPDCLHLRSSDIYLPPVKSIAHYKPSGLTQLTQCVCYDMELLRTAFPEARIILVTPPQNNKNSVDDQVMVGNYIAGCAMEMRQAYIPLTEAFDVFYGPDIIPAGFSKDGVHTTVKGAKVLGKYIYEQVKAIVQQ
ncbi:MAG: SGNH/GDSL hydrolase family protein [Prevotella sp.]|nr:SGNH/GDSL hydrolase family protein [Prevotella sp.]